MEESAILALVITVGCFMAFCISLWKYGIDGSIKVWSVVGTAVGAIVSFYFTDRSNNQEVEQWQSKYAFAQTAFTDALAAAQTYELQYQQLESALRRSERTNLPAPEISRVLRRSNEDVKASADTLKRLDDLRGKILLPGVIK